MAHRIEKLLPTTHVGSLPRPIFMQGKVFDVGVTAPEFPSFRMRELYHAAVALTVKDQLDAGLDIVTDGGQHYENETDHELAEIFHMLPHHMEGFLPYGDRIVFGAADLPIWKPTVVGPVAWRRPIFKPVIEAVKAATNAPTKINFGLGPVTMALMTTDQYYGGDVKGLAMDIAAAYNAELKDLAARGLEQVQFAEPLTMLFSALEPEGWIADVINRSFEGVDMYRVMHMCYGHQEGQNLLPKEITNADKVFPWAFDIECDQIHIEMASKDLAQVGAFKGWPADKDLGIGVIDVKTLVAETPETVAGRIRTVLDVVPAERVHISTDCSLASFRRVVARKKLSALVAGADIVRRELTGN